jgi:intein/homing endonuclease
MNLNHLAELSGVILGDGSLHNSCNRITIVGSLDDKQYFESRIIPLFNKNFIDVNPILRKNKHKNSYSLSVENKLTFNTFIKQIGMARGAKNNVEIPKFIFKNKSFIIAFLRGLFDTDGCLKFSKQTKNINYYPRIQLGFKESPFAHQIEKLLIALDFKFSKWLSDNNRGYYKSSAKMVYYHVSGKENLIKWMKIIKPTNQVQSTKYLFWKKYGYYVPKSTLKERLSMLRKTN